MTDKALPATNSVDAGIQDEAKVQAYRETDPEFRKLVAEIERLQQKLSKAQADRMRGNCRIISDGEDCKCDLCLREKEIERLREQIAALHPRVWKLAAKGEFVCVGQHEPYYLQVLDRIREQEMRQGTWTEEDRIWYMAQKMEADKQQETADESISRAVDWSIPKPVVFTLGFCLGVILTVVSWLLVGPPG